jgi:3-oxoacyl-[acyl-carrier protein] reductase
LGLAAPAERRHTSKTLKIGDSMASRRVALVTGSTANIGRSIASALLARGDAVVLNGRDPARVGAAVERLRDQYPDRVEGVAGDAAAPDVVQELVIRAVDAFGALHTVVHVPAIRPVRGFADIELDEWRQVFRTNVESLLHLAQAALPPLLKSGSGRLVGFSGATAFSGRRKGAHVVASKWAVVGLIRSIAYEFASEGLTANTIVPGPVQTDRSAHDSEVTKAAGGNPWRNPPLVGRFGDPAEIAATVAFVTSEDAGYLTGQSIHVNGGETFY